MEVFMTYRGTMRQQQDLERSPVHQILLVSIHIHSHIHSIYIPILLPLTSNKSSYLTYVYLSQLSKHQALIRNVIFKIRTIVILKPLYSGQSIMERKNSELLTVWIEGNQFFLASMHFFFSFLAMYLDILINIKIKIIFFYISV